MGSNKWNPGCDCCCVLLNDRFNRDTGTDMGSDWSEEAGSWEIETGGVDGTNCAATNSTDAQLRHTFTTTDGVKFEAALKLAVSDKLQMRVGDSTNTVEVEFERQADIGAEVQVDISLDGTLQTTATQESPGDFYTARICFRDGIIVVSLFGTVWVTDDSLADFVPTWVELATGDVNAGATKFDNALIEKFDSDCPCTSCADACQNNNAPLKIQVDIAGIVSNDPDTCLSAGNCLDGNTSFVCNIVDASEESCSNHGAGDESGDPCCWYLNLVDPGPFGLVLCDDGVFTDDFAQVYVTIWTAAQTTENKVKVFVDVTGAASASFEKLYDTAPNCTKFDGEDIPVDATAVSLCDFSNITCTITSL